MQKSLGLIETQGLAGGIEAADAAVKSANVELIGYELTRGGGWTTVKIQGDVGAVKAAVDAARIAAGKVNRVVSTKVIPRPASGLEMLVRNGDTVGYQPPEPPREPDPPAPPEPPVGPDEPAKEEAVPVPEPEAEPVTEAPVEAVAAPETAPEAPAEKAEAPAEQPAPEPEAPAESSAPEPAPEPEAVQEAPAEEPEEALDPPVQEPAPEAEAPAGEAKPKAAKKSPIKRGGKRK